MMEGIGCKSNHKGRGFVRSEVVCGVTVRSGVKVGHKLDLIWN